jgi:lysozyme
MRLSERGLELLREFEGFRDRAYPDPGSRDGLPVTIGYGSTRYEDGSPIKLGDTITRERADEMLRREVAETEGAVDRLVTVPLAQSQFDALVSFAFNVGLGALTRSTLLRLLNAGDYAGAADQFLSWNKNDGAVMEGLTRRRQRERAMFTMPPGIDTSPKPVDPVDTRPNDAFAGFDLPPAPNLPPGKVFPSFPPAPQPTASKPMAPVLAALLPSLVSLLPELGKLFGSGGAVSDRNIAAAQKVAEAVVAATGAPNLQGAVEQMASDPGAVTRAREALAPMLELHEAGGGGIEGARDFNATMHAVPFWLMPAFWISALLMPLLYYTVHVVLTGNGSFSGELKAAIASSVVTGVLGGIIGFWLGSSFTTSRSRGLGATPANDR